jgi:hypothetical protein
VIVVLVAAAAATVAGAVLALSTRDARTALGGIAALLLASPLVADPLPAIVPLAGRIVGAVLAIELLWIAVREARRAETAGASPAIDVRVEALAAGAGVVGGIFVGLRYVEAGVPLPGLAPLVLGTAFGLIAVGATPLLISRDTLRLGTGAVVVLVGAILVRGVTGGVQSALDSLIASGLVVAAAAAVAAVMLNAMTAAGDLTFDDTLAIEAEQEPSPAGSPTGSRSRGSPRASGVPRSPGSPRSPGALRPSGSPVATRPRTPR